MTAIATLPDNAMRMAKFLPGLRYLKASERALPSGNLNMDFTAAAFPSASVWD
jgi:hypothetical protein